LILLSALVCFSQTIGADVHLFEEKLAYPLENIETPTGYELQPYLQQHTITASAA